MERDIKLENDLIYALKEYSVTIDLTGEAYKLKALGDSKSITVTWPYPLMEVFFDFSQDNEEIFSESVEFYEGEPVSELRDYVTYVTKRFLKNPTRIETLGKILKRTELQINEGEKWVCVFD